MILLIGGRGTSRARRRLPPEPAHPGDDGDGVRVLEPAGLSEPGWAHDPDNPQADRMVIDGEVLPVSRLTAVRSTLDEVSAADLPHVRPADRQFVAAEMTAFLRSWLATLACPVAAAGSATAVPGTPGTPLTAETAGNAANRDPLVLLWGAPEEPPLAAVHRALLARGARVVIIDQRHALATRLLRRPEGTLLRVRGQTVALAEVTAAYPRPYSFLPEIPDGRPARRVALRHVARLHYELWQWAASTPAIVANRPGPAASNNAKPLQTRVARCCGFRVPESLLTNDPPALRAFAERHGAVIYKGASGVRTFTGLLDLSDTARLARLSTCPTYFQRYIRGTNTRVHVVGQDVFASEIDTEAVDYRADPGDMRPVVLPGTVAGRCLAVTRELGLLLTGIDLIRTPDGEWYFLEANPSPGFTFFPDSDRVAAAIARLLTRDPPA